MNDSAPTPSFDSILASLIEAQERAKDQPVDVNQWMEKYPQYAAQIHSFFVNRGKLEDLLGPRAVVDSEAPTIGGKNEVGEGQRIRYFGDYELLSEIARGGMGVVFKARQVSLNRVVAVKMILSGNLAGPSDVQRFHGEAEAAANLDHPHIVPIYEVGEHEGQHYFSMKLIEGSSLSSAKNDTHGSPKEKQRRAASLVAQVARAVHHAHQRGILHRDLKPGNILIDNEGEPHVTDFGLAKKVEGGSDLTNTGAIVGTPAYMAPEQARCEKGLSTAADVYSLGAILYALLTGHPPFKAETPLDTILQVLEKEPERPSSIVQSIDRDLETITLKCLEKEPSRRFGSAEALAEELERWQRGEPITIRPVGQWERGWRWCKRHPTIAVLAATILAVLLIASLVASTLAWWALDNQEQAKKSAIHAEKKANEAIIERHNAQNETQIARRLLGMSHIDRGLRSWQDGKENMALLWFAEQPVADFSNPENEQTARIRIASHRHYSNTPHLQILNTFSHLENCEVGDLNVQSSRIAIVSRQFGKQGSVHLFDFTTGEALLPPLLNVKSLTLVNFSKNRQKLAMVSSNGAVQVYDFNARSMTSLPMHHFQSARHALFNNDGSKFLVVEESQIGASCNTYICDATTGQPLTPLMKHSDHIVQAEFSLDGKRVVTACWNDTASVWDAVTGQPLSTSIPSKKMSEIPKFDAAGSRILAISSDFKTHVYGARIWDAFTGIALTPLLRHNGALYSAEFSPNSMRVVTASEDNTARVWDSVTGQPITPPLRHDGFVWHAKFSPDGRYVLTASNDGNARVWHANTGQPLTSFLSLQGTPRYVTFDASGRRVVVVSSNNMKDFVCRIWDISNIGQAPTHSLKHKDSLLHASFSPDSKRVLTASQDKTARIWNAHSGEPVTHALPHESYVLHASFSPDSQHIVTSSIEAHIWDVNSGKHITQNAVRTFSNMNYSTFSRNGQQILTASSDGSARLWNSRTGQPIGVQFKHEKAVNYAIYSQDGSLVATSSDDNTARVWDSSNGHPITSPLQHGDKVKCTAFSPDGRFVITSSFDRTAQIWSCSTGKLCTPPLRHEDLVFHAEFDIDGKRVITASIDKTARVWDSQTGTPLFGPLQHEKSVTHASFSSDGKRILTASDGARVWDASTGQPITPTILPNAGMIRHAEFSPDGQKFVTAGDDHAAHICDVLHDSRPWPDLIRFVQVTAGAKLDSFGGYVKLDPQTELLPWFNEIKAKYPADFSVSPEEARAWRENEIAQCFKEGNLPAAYFHRDWLIAEMVQEAAKSKKTP